MTFDTITQPAPYFYIPTPPPPKKDVLHVVMSDTHSGSNYALFLSDTWQGTKENNHTPTSMQPPQRGSNVDIPKNKIKIFAISRNHEK